MRCVHSLLLFIPLLGFPPPAAAQSLPDSGPTVGVLYIDTPTGARFLAGVEAALRDFATENGHAQTTCIRESDSERPSDPVDSIRCNAYPYTNEKFGLEILEDILSNESVDLILGPTDSGVFVDAIDKRRDLEGYGIPVVSSMVTADIPHQTGGWFFRTNVDVNRRSEAIYDFLNRRWVRSIALLYAKNAFGRGGEEAFRNELSDSQRSRYMPMLYESPPMQSRHHLKQILLLRPEAVGIIGSREDINELYGAIERMNTSTEYSPIFFTIIDARYAGNEVDDMYFVTLVNGSDEITSTLSDNLHDDVAAMSYDTTRMVLDQLQLVLPYESRAEMRVRLRDRIEAVMKGTSIPGSLTDLSFSGYLNIRRPKVAHLHQADVEDPDLGSNAPRLTETRVENINLDNPVNLWGNLVLKYELTMRRFGFWPWINVILIIGIVVGMSVADIKKWYPGSRLSLFFNPQNFLFYVLILINALSVIPVYIYMGETGAIQYDSVIAAVALAVAPMAILRTNLFETPAGKTIGLGKMYDSLIQWINHRLMIKKHIETKQGINLIAYNNSVDGMKSYLSDLYMNHRTVAQRIRLQTELDEMVNDSLPYLERRKVCARLLIRTLPWEVLVEEGMAPAGEIRPPGKKHKQNTDGTIYLSDPEIVIRVTARLCAGSATARKKVDDAIDCTLESFGVGRQRALRNAHERDLEGVVGLQGRLRRKLAFLSILCGFDEQLIRGMVDADKEAGPGGGDMPAEDATPAPA